MFLLCIIHGPHKVSFVVLVSILFHLFCPNRLIRHYHCFKVIFRWKNLINMCGNICFVTEMIDGEILSRNHSDILVLGGEDRVNINYSL